MKKGTWSHEKLTLFLQKKFSTIVHFFVEKFTEVIWQQANGTFKRIALMTSSFRRENTAQCKKRKRKAIYVEKSKKKPTPWKSHEILFRKVIFLRIILVICSIINRGGLQSSKGNPLHRKERQGSPLFINHQVIGTANCGGLQ